MLIDVPTRRLIEPRRGLVIPSPRWHRRRPPLSMAYSTGQVELDASGNVGLTSDGKVVVDKSCFACAFCPDTLPGAFTAVVSGVTLCACSSLLFKYELSGSVDGTYTLSRASDCGYVGTGTLNIKVYDVGCSGSNCYDGPIDLNWGLDFSNASFFFFYGFFQANIPSCGAGPPAYQASGEVFYHAHSRTGNCNQTWSSLAQSLATTSGSCGSTTTGHSAAQVAAYGGSVTLTPA